MPPRIPISRRVRDARGRVVELRASGRAVVDSAAWWQRVLIIGLLPMASMIFWWFPLRWALERVLARGAAEGIMVVLALSATAWGLLGMAMLVWVMLPWNANRRVAAWRVRLSHCGACAYPLKGLESESDGCVVCPECGGAWRTGGAG
jgi:hypothetical protein